MKIYQKIFNDVVSSSFGFVKRNYPDDYQIPDQVFGVFVGLERSPRDTLPHWPKEVHGCIGYWNLDYSEMDQQKIINKIKEVSYSATWVDDRRKYFNSPIYFDIRATFKVYYLIRPVYPIDPETGNIKTLDERFNNDMYGIIVTDGSHQATYLPQVFEKISWDNLKKSISRKAMIGNNSSSHFLAYHSIIQKMTMMDYYLDPIINAIDQIYGDFIPSTIINGQVIVDKSHAIRNLFNIYQLLRLKIYGYSLNDHVKQKIMDNIRYYQKIELSYHEVSILMIIKLETSLDIFDELTRVLVKYLRENQDSINQNTEIFDILNSILLDDPSQVDFIKYFDRFYQEELENRTISWDKIFRYQRMAMLIQNYPYRDKIKPLINLIIDRVSEILSEYQNLNQLETNYLAVAFECLTALHTISPERIEKMSKKFIYLLKTLESRRSSNGLFAMIDGEIRLDITGHVMSGYYNLA